MLRRTLLASLAVLALAPLGLPSSAQAAFPERSVRIVVPFPAGGSNDVIARLLAQNLTEQWGQPVVVENRAGAGGNVGAEVVARAAADGYTLLLAAPGPLVVNQTLYSKLNYDPAKDLKPIALIASVPIVLAVNPKVEAKTVAELIALAKKQPGKINFGSSGNGSTNHLAGELLKDLAKIDIVHVPYRGAAPAMNDLIAGHIPMMFDNMPAMKPQVAAGTVRALAVASATRSKLFPELPTMIEAGVPGFEATAWFGLVAPAATPADVTKTIIAGVEKALQNPDMAKKLADLGAEPGNVSGDAFGDFLKAETAKWGKVVKDSGARVD
ncbi:tripartite tricarboxylate transporter substrate binding protein [Pseudolabrys taiwanensis]|uniref:Tripartite tricarboxylate transporter substrate binding protein n=1 Tax=Pseudolabrys taiwanensis TaxID=331696 RepID=A0A345ZWS9_9HYPH|nr:tripartite tricarboxylate transporter substrate binding protein [Pseudolabrys taiwanensis]AXK81376.1 tripartite tricarboxylate transporter substrate binding protein [Pseudolabrys taiwanensis]